MRITHRLCRAELASLAGEAEQLEAQNEKLGKENETLTQKNTSLVDDLQATEHALDEVEDACTNIEYGTTEASIPDVLRERLDELRTRVSEHDNHLVALLITSWEQGRLARTLALLLSTAGTTAQRQRVEDAYDTAQRQFGVPSTGRITTLRTSGTWSYSPGDPRVSCPVCSATRGLTLVYHLDRAQEPGQMVCPDGHTGPAPYWAMIVAALAVQDGQADGETQCAVDSLPEVILAAADQVLPAPTTIGTVDITALAQVPQRKEQR